MKLTRRLAKSQLKINRRRTIWTILGIILSTTMIATVYGLVASVRGLVETIWEGSVLRLHYEAMLAGLGVILGFVIITSSIVVLSNAFRVSAKERTMQFGILKSVGATKKQITQTVLSESIQLSLIGIPIGILAGLSIQFIGVELINHFLSDIFQSARPDASLSVPFVLSWQMLLLSVALSIATVSLSAWLPARKASKVAAIDAIRGAGEVKVTGKSTRAGWMIGKLFGFEGTLAARSLKRSRRNFRATVVVLSLSVALFITLGSFVTQMNRLTLLTLPDMEANVTVGYHSHQRWTEDEDGTVLTEFTAISREVADTITRRFEAYTGAPVFGLGRDGWTYSTILPREMLTPQGLERMEQISLEPIGEEQWFSVLLMTVDQTHYALLAERAGVPLGSNILVNHVRTNTPDGRRWEFEPLRFSGQTLELSSRYDGGTRELPLHGVLSIGEVPNEIMHEGTQDITIIVPDEPPAVTRYLWFVSAEDPTSFSDYAFDLIGEIDFGEGGNWHVFNSQQEQEMMRSLITLITTFVWGFVALLTLIYLTNIISTIAANVQSRAKEFAVLQSAGMTHGGLNRMLNLESVLSSIKSLFIGVPLGILGAYFVYLAVARAAQFNFALPWIAIAISILAVLTLTWIVIRYAAKQLRKRNIVDTIRGESGM